MEGRERTAKIRKDATIEVCTRRTIGRSGVTIEASPSLVTHAAKLVLNVMMDCLSDFTVD